MRLEEAAMLAQHPHGRILLQEAADFASAMMDLARITGYSADTVQHEFMVDWGQSLLSWQQLYEDRRACALLGGLSPLFEGVQ